jgi:hypothetical protein
LLAKLKIDNMVLYAEMMLDVADEVPIDYLISHLYYRLPFMIVAGSGSRILNIGYREMQLQSAGLPDREITEMAV